MLEGLWIVSTYFLGAVPYGVIIARIFCGIDPRQGGSHNTGATNVARLCGFFWGVLTLACDVLKGALPVWYAAAVINDSALFVSLVALSAVLGHAFSCFMGFKGGKAVATTIGVFMPLAFGPLLLSCLICVVVIWRSGFVSLGSLTLVSVLPPLLLLFGPREYLLLALGIAVLVIWKHKENIHRLVCGMEQPWLTKKHDGGVR